MASGGNLGGRPGVLNGVGRVRNGKRITAISEKDHHDRREWISRGMTSVTEVTRVRGARAGSFFRLFN